MFTFRKAERLSSKKEIDLLFRNNKGFIVYPIKFTWRLNNFDNTGYPVRLLVSVPKRIYKRAVDRNFLKRRIREAYRLSKSSFYSELNTLNLKIDLQIAYIGKEKEEFQKITDQINLGLNKLISRIKP